MKSCSMTVLLAVLCMSPLSWASDWPCWRGPLSNGSSNETALPDSLNKADWVSELPGPSGATPVVCRGRVFVSSMHSDEEGAFSAICFDAVTGKELWRKRIGKDTSSFPRNNMATPSPVTDGTMVFFHFGSGHLAALDYLGQVVWSRNIQQEFGNLSLKYGYSSSPLLYDGKLYVTVMRRPEIYRDPPTDGPLDSFIVAINAKTGKDIWKTVRKTNAVNESFDSYSTGVIFHRASRNEMLTIGGDYVMSHDPDTGAELWRYGYNAQREEKWRNIPSVVTGDGLIFHVTARAGQLTALKSDRSGTLTAADIAWTFDGPTTDSSTPAYCDGCLYVLYGRGKTLTCLNAKTGNVNWQGKLPGRTTYYASPIVADGKVYCLSEGGDAVVLAAGADEFKIISSATFDEGPMQSTIAVADGRLYLRTAKRLYCLTR